MRRLFEAQLTIAEQLPSSTDTFTHLCSLVRSLYQTTAVVALEVVRTLTPEGIDNPDFSSFAKRFNQPTDGLPIEILEVATPIIRSYVSATYHAKWFLEDKVSENTLAVEAAGWVAFRNKKPGHGVLSKADIEEWNPRISTFLRRSLTCFGDTLPQVTDDGRLKVVVGNSEMLLNTPLLWEGMPVVISSVDARRGMWKLRGQTLNWEKSDTFAVDLPSGSVFEELESNNPEKFQLIELELEDGPHSIYSNVPVRQTSIFEGRSTELSKLADWFNHLEDNKICLIYGDGGLGKTTLALEFLNRVFEGAEDLTAKPPSIICYYSAKMTRWTDQGVEHLRGISDAMEDCVREVLFVLTPVLDKSYYKLKGTELVDRVAAEFAHQKFKRDDILLVLDNTETLIKSSSEVDAFALFVKQIGRRLGRVLITSRRRELVAFEPIPMEPLSDDECISLMRRLAEEYAVKAIKQAGDATLRKAAGQLAKMPLLIDTLVKYLARSPAVGIEKAIELVVRKNDDELLQFLYEDAWHRFDDRQRDVCLILISVVVPLDNLCVADACALIGIHPSDFIKGLDEAYFTTTVDRGERYDLTIVEMARRFFEKLLQKRSSSERRRLEEFAGKVDSQATVRERIDSAYRSDRVAEAFRSHFAKAAKIATAQGDLPGAEDNFRLALEDDPMNAALKDRFAWFLLHRRQRPEDALKLAQEAQALDPDSSDAALTLALCWYRLNDIANGDREIDAAQRKGKSQSLCSLRKGIARHHAAKKANSNKEATALLDEGDLFLHRAKDALMPSDGYMDKNYKEALRYESLNLALRRRIRSRPLGTDINS